MLPLLLSAQTTAEKQAAAVAKQREAIARQLGVAASSADAFFLLPWPDPAPAACNPLVESELQPMVREAAQREGIKPELLRAVMAKESGFRPCAVSPKGAMGLMQLMPATVELLGVRDPFDPKESIDAGAKYLKKLLARYNGDVPSALAAYNAGTGRVDSAGGIPAIPETLDYVRGILAALAH